MNILRSCPFCKGKARLVTGGERFVYPECSKCGAKLPAFFGVDKIKNAIMTWNRRIKS
ncbi:MAG: Lar family restriction alleviation protein [Synergistaceae bacterium]|nr:Lar family restriction alleviation protein [Synergistaceae bacterium]